jgi:hypothetical protein
MSKDLDLAGTHEWASSLPDPSAQQDNAPFGLGRRTAPRVESHDNGAVVVQNVCYAVEICDVSQNGAQIRMRQGLMPAVGRDVTLRFVDGTCVESRVLWERGTLVGLQFQEPLPDALDFVHFDDLGSEYFRAVLRLQILHG